MVFVFVLSHGLILFEPASEGSLAAKPSLSYSAWSLALAFCIEFKILLDLLFS
jgi:hypothetical protein